MIFHLLCGIIIVVAIIVAVIVALTGSVTTGVIIGVAGVGGGVILALLNFGRIWRNQDKLLPNKWRF